MVGKTSRTLLQQQGRLAVPPARALHAGQARVLQASQARMIKHAAPRSRMLQASQTRMLHHDRFEKERSEFRGETLQPCPDGDSNKEESRLVLLRKQACMRCLLYSLKP